MKKLAIIKKVTTITLIATIATILFLPCFTISRNPDSGWQSRLITSLIVFGLSIITMTAILIRLYRVRKLSIPFASTSYEVVIVLCGLAMCLSGGIAFNCIWSSHIQYKTHLRHSHMHLVGIAMQMYCEDNGGQFPSVNTWRKAIQPYAAWEICDSHGKSHYVHLQLSEPLKADYAYGMNSKLAGKNIRAIKAHDKTIMVFESTPSLISSDSPDSFPMPEKNKYRSIVYADGTLDYIVDRSDLKKVRWSLE